MWQPEHTLYIILYNIIDIHMFFCTYFNFVVFIFTRILLLLRKNTERLYFMCNPLLYQWEEFITQYSYNIIKDLLLYNKAGNRGHGKWRYTCRPSDGFKKSHSGKHFFYFASRCFDNIIQGCNYTNSVSSKVSCSEKDYFSIMKRNVNARILEVLIQR